MYLTHADPLAVAEQSIRDKVISVCVDKYQHTKVKSSPTLTQSRRSCSSSH